MKKTQTIMYRRTRLIIKSDKNIRKGICESCGRKEKTDLHHVVYAYSTKIVKKNHLLALENTVELCYRCHRIANAMRIEDENPLIYGNLRKLIK